MHTLLRSLSCIAAAGIVLAHCGGCGKEQKKEIAEREIRVTLKPLEKRVFRHQIPVQGTVWPVEYAVLSAKISGTLELLKVDEGDVRKKGDTLFGIDRQILKNQVTVREDEIKVKQAELESAKLSLQSAKILEEKATLDYKRFLSLWSSKATSESEFETYETNYKKAETDVNSAQAAIVNAEAQLKQAEGNLVIARKNLDDSIVYAPFDCVVTDKYVEENEYVVTGQNILRLENPGEQEVICYISAGYYDMVKAGTTPVIFALDGVEKGRGVVTYKAPSIDPESRTFKLKVQVPREIQLVSGTLCDLNIILEEKEAYGLPADAMLLRANDRYIVYAIDKENRAKSIDVVRGIVDGKYCEVVNADNLLNERIVVTGQTFVNNGSLLRPINAE
ncbi:efflux RND transporter periplasmic adaptor subunit [uncultured Victivallis sp.]|uniref:efflux RND transporter periplasmic adaptor subunit n=1 Tax=uncultured Victivallis sp. TaxID=354118 RepID=UPI0025E69DDC|nr:efflux RND transporter periplasmic adaptor subunit [uncultured Victivallis sp.]